MSDNKKITAGILAILFLGLAGSSVYAQGAPTPSGVNLGFLQWAQWIYPFAFSAAAILAVLMLVIAGIEMMTAAPGLREDAKKRIWAAIGGLLLAVLSYLILYTINPSLTQLRLDTSGLQINITNNNSSQPPTTGGNGAINNPIGDINTVVFQCTTPNSPQFKSCYQNAGSCASGCKGPSGVGQGSCTQTTIASANCRIGGSAPQPVFQCTTPGSPKFLICFQSSASCGSGCTGPGGAGGGNCVSTNTGSANCKNIEP